MRFALMSEPQQGLTYAEILALVQTAEEAGFGAYFRSDHYASFPGGSGLPPGFGQSNPGPAGQTFRMA
jgi:alkanesulfonate monooxygenase SsuD/methylene tetrahydromethanopterin reductase-like flavin-dependent oxidoreductase (luciferase family)